MVILCLVSIINMFLIKHVYRGEFNYLNNTKSPKCQFTFITIKYIVMHELMCVVKVWCECMYAWDKQRQNEHL